MKTRTRTASAVVALLLIVSACSEAKPIGQWEQDWQRLLDELPALETMLTATEDQAMELCGDALGVLRDTAPELQEIADADLETAAITFVDFAESVFFECPIRTGDHAGFEAGYAEMDHLRSAVGALLADDQ